jgi:ubiquitin-protein ligase E3 D
LIFLTVTGAVPGVEIEAEVLPSFLDVEEGDHFVIKSGPNMSPPLILPARTFPGKKEVKVQNDHYEIKLSTSPFIPVAPPETLPLLDASQLSTLSPMNFTCSSCSLPLVHSHTIESYRDLPSEHWEELVDAWMCHSDQSLHEQITNRGRGFWPEPGQALVGGSYILFEESSIVLNNLWRSGQPKVSFVLVSRDKLARTAKKTGVGFPPTVVCFENWLSYWK